MDAKRRNILVCRNDAGLSQFEEWLDLLDGKIFGRIQVRLDRLAEGNFGDVRPVGEGVSELRIDLGPGYRVYFGQRGLEVYLIRGGTKRRSRATSSWRLHSGESMSSQSTPYKQYLSKCLSGPATAAHYLTAALDDSPHASLTALRNIHDTRNENPMTELPAMGDGVPDFEQLSAILHSLGLQLAVAVETAADVAA